MATHPARDPAWARSSKAAVVVPSAFAIATALSTNSQLGLFASFGSVALTLFVDFPGTPRARLRAYGVLLVVGTGWIALGTACSEHPLLAVASMAMVGFAVLFAGVVSRQAATGAMAALLTFVLPVSVAVPPGQIPIRIGGWLLAGALAVPVAMLGRRRPPHDELREQLSATARALHDLVSAHAEGRLDDDARAAADAAVTALRAQFEASAYRPTGAWPGDTAVAKLVGRLEWVAANATVGRAEAASLDLTDVRHVNRAVAEVLEASAALIRDVRGSIGSPAAARLRTAATSLAAARDASMARAVDHMDDALPQLNGGRLLSVLDPTFRARALSYAAGMVAEATLDAVDHHRPAATWRTVRQAVASHANLGSVWLRNSLRGAVGMTLSVAVVEATAVEHGFWVILGTMSVLRSNALGTGATALRALGGTVVGFVIGSVITVGLGSHHALLWAVLPVAVLLATVAPSAISFAAGQAGFTVLAVIIFNILHPTGWTVGLTRVEDVAIGCGVSVLVGLLFWPRGATSALGRALGDALARGSGYLLAAVERATSSEDGRTTERARVEAEGAYQRMDDAFRQYLWERGAKPVPLCTVTDLFTGAVRTRLAAHSLAVLPPLPASAAAAASDGGSAVAAAGTSLRRSCDATHRWYLAVALVLAGRSGAIPAVPEHDPELQRLMVAAFDDARRRQRWDEVHLAIRILWADEGLHAELALQRELAGAAQQFAHRRRGPIWNTFSRISGVVCAKKPGEGTVRGTGAPSGDS